MPVRENPTQHQMSARLGLPFQGIRGSSHHSFSVSPSSVTSANGSVLCSG